MGAIDKFTTDGVIQLFKHNGRYFKNNSNTDINPLKTCLNYSFDDTSNDIKQAEQIFHEELSKSYLYGRNTQREVNTITACGWVFTLPKEVSDYSTVSKDKIAYINPEEEKEFFNGIYDFISARYGSVFYNRVHYDEAAQPHIHIYFIPRTKLDHDLARFKTQRTKKVKQTESGRYEYVYRLVKDEYGNPIPLKNYAKMTDYYDTKISAFDVCNKAEMQHIHKSAKEYMVSRNIPGGEYVYTSKTGGINFSVKTLKNITKLTGLTLDQIKEIAAERKIEISNKNELNTLVKELSDTIQSKDCEIEKLKNELDDMSHKLQDAQTKIKELETNVEKEKSWGTKTWDNTSSWGQKNTTIEEEKTW